jgi:hypothetical protein
MRAWKFPSECRCDATVYSLDEWGRTLHASVIECDSAEDAKRMGLEGFKEYPIEFWGRLVRIQQTGGKIEVFQ